MDTEDAPLTAAEKFQALLRPIKDVALAFDVDVDDRRRRRMHLGHHRARRVVAGRRAVFGCSFPRM